MSKPLTFSAVKHKIRIRYPTRSEVPRLLSVNKNVDLAVFSVKYCLPHSNLQPTGERPFVYISVARWVRSVPYKDKRAERATPDANLIGSRVNVVVSNV